MFSSLRNRFDDDVQTFHKKRMSLCNYMQFYVISCHNILHAISFNDKYCHAKLCSFVSTCKFLQVLAILCNLVIMSNHVQAHAIKCNFVQYHANLLFCAIKCKFMQLHASSWNTVQLSANLLLRAITDRCLQSSRSWIFSNLV